MDDFISTTVVFIGMSAKHYIPILRKYRERGLEPTPRNVFKMNNPDASMRSKDGIYAAKAF